jgi:MOSC domain-containing protein YiiM
VHVAAVNISAGRVVDYAGEPVETGIFKEPVAHAVHVHRLGVEGDRIADLTVHGGEDKAVYAYSQEHYAWWRGELGRDLAPGAFGENLTIAGLDEWDTSPGDVFRIGTAVLVAVQPREPCYKLGLKFGDMKMVTRFFHSGRLGVYFRVMQEGDIRVGDAVECVTRVSPRFPLPDLLRLRYAPDVGDEELQRALSLPGLSAKWRRILNERL